MEVTLVDINELHPNPWNPNEQTARQYEAEIESLKTYGFVQPIIARENPDGEGFQIIDGEHRYKAMRQMMESEAVIEGDLSPLIESKKVPVVVVDLDDESAMKLTIIMNETRGEANTNKLSDLLAELSQSLDFNELMNGLPYSEQELKELVEIGDFDWSKLVPPDPAGFEPDETKTTQRIVCAVTTDINDRFKAWIKELGKEYNLPDDLAQANGFALQYLLDKGEIK